jgi:uncharacterized protein YbdZ (MbtH family)
MGAQEVYGIIVNGDHQFAVWPSKRPLPKGWLFTGPTGTRAEMLSMLKLQYVETVAAPLLTPGRLPRATEWAD